ncbi:HAD family hydrolase [Effusibacillus pohliae]|uniref:HAD family hydrolase n=1 Tax=Effusibacillus pohliae TaxID=232270 RepID=UPI0003773985|nr:HAD family hydrolase [Effusibacillus pohliae]
MIKAVVFDFDGLIFDTETHEYRVLQEIYGEYGAELPLDVWGQCVGTHANFFDAYAYLESCTGKPVDREVLGKRRLEMFEERVQTETALPGVENYLAAAKRLGLKIGLASSSSRQWVTRWLTKLNLIDYFECIRTSDDVEHVKPDPALYLRALECLGVEPWQAIAFEDSPNGALAAKRAGMHVVIVPNFVTRSLPFGEHDLRLDSLAELELEQVIERLEK